MDTAKIDKETKMKKSPAIIIGCGGTGHNILRLLFEKYIEETGSVKKFNDLPIELLSIDTLVEPEARDTMELQKDDYLALGPIQLDTFMQKYYKNEEHIQKWFNPDQYAGLMSTGAMQIRAFGRLAMFIKIFDVVSKLEKKFGEVLNKKHVFAEQIDGGIFQVESGASVQIHIVGNIAGGTGSGIMLDLAFLLRYLSPTSLTITGHLIMPEAITDFQIRDSLFANSYAFLKELDNFNLNPKLYGQFSPISTYLFDKERVKEQKTSTWDFADNDLITKPFDYIYLLSPYTQDPSFLEKDFFHEVISEKIFLSSFNKIGDRELERKVNIRTTVIDQMYLSSELSTGKPCAYGSYGVSTLRVREKAVKNKIRKYIFDKIRMVFEKSEDKILFNRNSKLIKDLEKDTGISEGIDSIPEFNETEEIKQEVSKIFSKYDIEKKVQTASAKILSAMIDKFKENENAAKIREDKAGIEAMPRIRNTGEFDSLSDDEKGTYFDPEFFKRNLLNNLRLNLYEKVEEVCDEFLKKTEELFKEPSEVIVPTQDSDFSKAKEFDNILFYNFDVRLLENYIRERDKDIKTLESTSEIIEILNVFLEKNKSSDEPKRIIDEKVDIIWNAFVKAVEENTPAGKHFADKIEKRLTVSNFLNIMYKNNDQELEDILESFVSIATPCWRFNEHFSKYVNTISLLGCSRNNSLFEKVKGWLFFGSELEATEHEDDPFEIPLVISQHGLPLLGYEKLEEYKKSYLRMMKKFETGLLKRQFHLDKRWEGKNSPLIDPFEDTPESYSRHIRGQLFVFAWHLGIITKVPDDDLFFIEIEAGKVSLHPTKKPGIAEALNEFFSMLKQEENLKQEILTKIWESRENKDIDFKKELTSWVTNVLDKVKGEIKDREKTGKEDVKTINMMIGYIQIFINTSRLLSDLKTEIQELVAGIEQ